MCVLHFYIKLQFQNAVCLQGRALYQKIEAAGAFELLVPIQSTTVVCGAQVEHRE